MSIMEEFINKNKEFLKTNRVRKILKRIGFFILGILVVILIFFAGLRIYFTQNKDVIVTDINKKIPISIGILYTDGLGTFSIQYTASEIIFLTHHKSSFAMLINIILHLHFQKP